MRIKTDMYILEKFVKEHYNTIEKGIYEAKTDKELAVVMHDRLDDTFIPQKIVFAKEKINYNYIIVCIMTDKDNQEIKIRGFEEGDNYGHTGLFYSQELNELGEFFDCLEYYYLGFTYQFFRYLKKQKRKKERK
jgi:hypothetical protein